MPFRFEIDSAHHVLRVVVSGSFDDPALQELYRVAGEWYLASGAKAAILDLSEVTTFAVSTELIDQLSQSPTALPQLETPRFIVAPQAHVFGAMRMFQILGEPTRPRLTVVHSAAEVYVILGIEAPKFVPLGPG